MRALLALMLALVLVGCGGDDADQKACTEIGCNDGVTVEVGSLGDREGVTVEVCIRGGGPCAEAPVEPGQAEVFVPLELPEGDSVRLKVTARVGPKRAIAAATGEVPIESSTPNGPDCPPVCRQARFSL